mmetsp:Transcript_102443/g.181945  ORF Transcript_102443/g.181945 Transcript_102443/m.181945 type:complete len:510 (+) Transcript_102443:65-1594(+)
MDKICRGSRVGTAHDQGTWGQLERSDVGFRRGSHVTTHSPKLENTAPRRQTTGPAKPSTDTFRSQEWFRHEPRNPSPRSPPLTSPRFTRGAFGMSPSSSPRNGMQKSMSERLLSSQDTAARLFGGEPTPRGEKSPRREEKVDPAAMGPAAGLTRGRSEGFLGFGSAGREMSPRDTLFQDRTRGRPDTSVARSPSATGRTRSPTFNQSEDWWGYSKPKAQEGTAKIDKTMPSSNFSSSIRRQHSGKITSNSDNWLRVNGEDAKPAPPSIANSQNYYISRGKKTGLLKDADVAKNLMRLEVDKVQDTSRSNRKHDFQNHPQAMRHMEEFRVFSPRRLESARDTVKDSGRLTAGVQHRTSGEMVASISPEPTPVSAPGEKHVVGFELVDIASSGVRKADNCIKVAAQSGHGYPQARASRHHLNSDTVKEHIQPVDMPQFTHHSASHKPPTREEASRRVHVYGDFSAPPSTMPKDTAYIHSGLKVVKYQTRSPGLYSPNAPRVPASQMLLTRA